jgi:hypothetical protein
MIKTIYYIAQHVLTTAISRQQRIYFNQQLAPLSLASESDSHTTSMRMCYCMSR